MQRCRGHALMLLVTRQEKWGTPSLRRSLLTLDLGCDAWLFDCLLEKEGEGRGRGHGRVCNAPQTFQALMEPKLKSNLLCHRNVILAAAII